MKTHKNIKQQFLLKIIINILVSVLKVMNIKHLIFKKKY